MTEAVAQRNKASIALGQTAYSIFRDTRKEFGISRFRPATEEEDKYEKIDCWFRMKGLWVPIWLRAFCSRSYIGGFPIRDTSLKNANEMEKLLAGEMDSYRFIFGAWSSAYSFKIVKTVMGKSLRENASNVIGERTFEEDDGSTNHMTIISDPADTCYLRKEEHNAF